ncbi:hypothetical protein [Streptomyces sp. NPDC018045]|uniref:hypothetical protein n=1 Tax=Streptomyces sp. NPDC018045 TaxID=3365037 RepID=UPI003795DED9
MSTLTLLVILLLALVDTLTFGDLAYLGHRLPALHEPLLVGLARSCSRFGFG